MTEATRAIATRSRASLVLYVSYWLIRSFQLLSASFAAARGKVSPRYRTLIAAVYYFSFRGQPQSWAFP
jgi:hypothetical protein